LYNSTLNIARGSHDDGQDKKANDNLDDDVLMLDDQDNISILLSGTITSTNKQDLLSAIRTHVLLITDAESSE
jgi:hypothetical protein